MTPVYQTDDDVASEESTIDFLREKWGRIERMPDFSEFDYAVINDNSQVRALIEVKNRKSETAKYRTIMISMTKLIAAKQWAEQGLKCFFVVRVGKGRPRMLDLNASLPERIGWGGRAGRNHDEPIAHFTKDQFTSI